MGAMDINTGRQTILVVDDDRTIRTLIRALLEGAGYAVLTASDGAEGFHVFQRYQENIALLLSDVTMPKMNGLQLAAAVRAVRPQLPVLFVSGNAPHADCGWGCIAKPFTAGELVGRVRQVLIAKETAETSHNGGGRVEQLADFSSPLTKREREVLQLICQGYTSKAIGDKLGISPKTAVCHRARILDKAAVHKTASLIRFAVRAGFIQA
jgi:FixJ family two-component response regulator